MDKKKPTTTTIRNRKTAPTAKLQEQERKKCRLTGDIDSVSL